MARLTVFLAQNIKMHKSFGEGQMRDLTNLEIETVSAGNLFNDLYDAVYDAAYSAGSAVHDAAKSVADTVGDLTSVECWGNYLYDC